jgi:hypothetical protein
VGLAGDDPVDGGVVGSQFIGSSLRTFLDRNPERVVLQPENGDAQRLFRHDVNRCNRGLVGHLAHGIEGRQCSHFAFFFRHVGQSTLGRPVLADVVLGHNCGLGDETTTLGRNAADDVVEETHGRVMALGEGVLADGGVDDALLDIFHGLVDEVEGDDGHFAGLACILDRSSSAEGTAGCDVDALEVRIGGHEVLGLGVGDVALVGVLDLTDDLDVGIFGLNGVDKPLAAQLMRFDSEEAGDDADLTGAADGLGHGMGSSFTLEIEVRAHEEESGILSIGLGVEGGDRDARIVGRIDVGDQPASPAMVAMASYS